MMKNITLILSFLLVMGGVPGPASAKWWIFGQGEQEIATRYLYLNGVAYDELGDKVTVYRESLENGQVLFKGRGQAGKNRVGAVQISLDGGASWDKARLADDGSFEFGFTPQMGESYQLAVKILDTAGKSNDVDATRKELTVSERNIAAVIREALDQMIAAYHAEDPRAFMALVDENFAGDATVLDRGVRKDFTAFDNLDLRYTLNNVTSGANGKVFAAITFSRQVTSARSGQTYQDRGVTEFIFVLKGDNALVSAMKHPLIFGLSEAEEVGTGTVNLGDNDQVLIVDDSGTLGIGTVTEAASGGSDAATLSGSFVLTNWCSPPCNDADGFNFGEDRLTDKISDSDIYKELNLLWGNGPVQLLDMGAIPFANLTVPAGGLWDMMVGLAGNEGHVFAVKLPDNTYAVIRYNGELGPGNNSFDYKYNPDGEMTFR